MIDLQELQQSAHIETDQNGQPVVQIPLEVWEAWLAQDARSHNARLLALLDEWEAEPDDTPAEWWNDFQAFLKANRLNLS